MDEGSNMYGPECNLPMHTVPSLGCGQGSKAELLAKLSV
jgi:hypothetical protein